MLKETLIVLLQIVLIILITFLTITNRIDPVLAIGLTWFIGKAKIEID